MRKVFLENLPRWRFGEEKINGEIAWKNCIGYKVKFIYDDIEGELLISNIIREKGRTYIVIDYGEYKNFYIKTDNFSNCKLGDLLGTITKRYKYNIGDNIRSVKFGELKILKQIKMLDEKKERQKKGYKYKCLSCGNIDIMSESNLLKNQGCNVCCVPTKKVLKGFNDLWTTHPQIAKMLKFPAYGHTISHGSAVKQMFICPDCGLEKSMTISNLINQGFFCNRCSDGVSIPEKFMFNVLEQLGLEFQTQLTKTTFNWCYKYRYDFYIPSLNGILEINGIQHYEQSNRGRSLELEQENDRLKQELALRNGIDKYIVIDCRKSELELIKQNILNSEISELFDLSNIDWLKCAEYVNNSLVKAASDLWESGMKNTSDIAVSLKLDRSTIITYLKKGKLLGWCDYYLYAHKCVEVICLSTMEIFKSSKTAEEKYNISRGNLNSCCKRNGTNRMSAGKHPITGEKLVWMYYDDYLKQPKLNFIKKEAV